MSINISAIDTFMNNVCNAVISIIESEPMQKILDAIEKFENGSIKIGNNINIEELIKNFTINSKIVDDIVLELNERNIDDSIMQGIEVEQAITLYLLAMQQNITFVDLIEANLTLFGKFEYENAKKYLFTIRKAPYKKHNVIQYVNPKFISDIEDLGIDVENEIIDSINKFNEQSLELKPNEKNIILAIQKNKLVTNEALAEKFNYSVRQVETICANIRAKLNLDFLEGKNNKRLLLILLAENIKIK